MRVPDSSSPSPNIPREVMLDALPKYWASNKGLDLSDILNDSRCLTNIRALLPVPFNNYHIDAVRECLHNLSKAGLIPKGVMTGEKTVEEYKASQMDKTSLHRMQGYLNQRELRCSGSYRMFKDSDEWKATTAAVRQQRDYTCQICKTDHGGATVGELECHHHSYGDGSFQAFLDTDNLWLLCNSCHSVVHFLKDCKKEPELVAQTLFA